LPNTPKNDKMKGNRKGNMEIIILLVIMFIMFMGMGHE